MTAPQRVQLSEDLDISRIVTGLSQVADMERSGTPLDPQQASDRMLEYARAGLDCFDVADDYGSAELITGRFLERLRSGELTKPTARVITKWSPKPGPMSRDLVRASVDRSRARLGVESIDLLQFGWGRFEHPSYIDALQELAQLQHEGVVRHIGLTNFDTAHLRLVLKHGIPVTCNQVCFSLLDRRAAFDMSAFCRENGVALLAYGTLAGGFISRDWLGKPEPGNGDIGDSTKTKYKHCIDSVGGWEVLQSILRVLDRISARHGVSISNIASRWILEHPAVAAVIIGARLGEREHRADNLALFSFALDDEDRAALDEVLAEAVLLDGDCGDEYRNAPLASVSGGPGAQADTTARLFSATPSVHRPRRMQVSTDSTWERIGGYSRAVRVGERILVSGTTATNAFGQPVCAGDAAGQTVFILDKISASLAPLGATLADVVRTRIYLKDAAQWEAVSRIHGHYFRDIRPANTLLEVSRLIDDYEVEIEAEAVVDRRD